MKNKVSICIVNPYVYSLFNNNSKGLYGGGEVQLFILSKELKKYPDFSINFLTGDYNLRKSRIEYYDKIKLYISIPQNKSFINYINRPLLTFYTLLRINPDVVIQRIAGIQTGICAFYCKVFKKIFIYSISHDREVIKNGIKGIQSNFYQYGLKNANYIIAQSNDHVNRLKKWKKKCSTNIKVIKTGYKIPEGKILIEKKESILWVGRAVSWKQPEIFLNLAKKFPDYKFIMIFRKGKLPHYWKKVKEKAKSISNLEFYNYIPFQKIDKFFQKALIFINTSIYEGFPNTFIQALKNATPIISLNVDPDNFLTINQCGFYCNNNLIDLEKNLKFLLSNLLEYIKYATNGYEYVKKNHNILNIGNQWAKLIKNLMIRREYK